MTIETAQRAAIAAHVETSFESDVLPTLTQYTEIPCLSRAFDPDFEASGHLARAASLLAGWSERRRIEGVRVEVVTLPGHTPVVLGEVPARSPGERGTTLVYGHFDKQPPLGNWAEGLDPFRAVRRGDRLYGRGTADDGYACFSAFTALEALSVSGVGHGRVVVLIEGSEESGSPDLGDYLELLAPRLGSPALVVCLDSGAATYDRLWLTSSLRGNVIATLRVEVLDVGVHSGAAGGIVPSSFRILRSLLERVEDSASGEILLPELRSAVPEARRAEIERLVETLGEEAAGSFPTVPGLVLSGPDAAGRVVSGTWAPALEVTGLAGAPPPVDAGNVLRPFTEAKLSIRLPPDVDAAVAVRALHAALSAEHPSGARIICEVSEPGSGFEAPPLEPWLAGTLDGASRAHFGAPPGVMGEGGSIPFLATLRDRLPEAQFVVTGVLGPESSAHGPNEF
ncbi:MAG TPA: M20/M25/M40 family metallo-hydrolase, partial [Acidimicrobiales bacterium]|nr:M20/M25/M40 family metallo-hydrolase [Acidimicrobiales bacterium]